VKDAFFNRSVDMEGMRESIAERDMQEVSPAHAMKFIAGAMHYSKDIGFAMHTEADACMMIFGDTNPAECTEDFEYGHNGKPHYLSGPHDSREKQSTILKVLEQLGEGNFHFSMMADDRGTFGAFATSEGLGYEDLDEDDEGYEEADDEDFEDDDYDGATSSRDEQTVDAQSVKDVSR